MTERVQRRSLLPGLAVGVVLLMALAGLVLAVVLSVRGTDVFALAGRVGVLEIHGVIGDDERYLEQIREYRRDPTVEAILVSINSPGGAVAPSQSIYRELKRVREEDGLPVVATIGSVGASGGYYIALAADTIFALPGSMTGSIGVIMELPDVSGLMERVGVGMQVVESAEHKDIGSPFRPLGEADREVIGELVQDVYAQFVEAVATERGIPAEAMQRLADGRVLSGEQALRAGLVDRTGNFTDALAAAGRMAGLGESPHYTRPREEETTLLDLLLGRYRGSAARLEQLLGAPGPRLRYAVPYSAR